MNVTIENYMASEMSKVEFSINAYFRGENLTCITENCVASGV